MSRRRRIRSRSALGEPCSSPRPHSHVLRTAGWAARVDRQPRRSRRGCTRQGRNAVEDLGQAQVAAAAGLKGSAATWLRARARSYLQQGGSILTGYSTTCGPSGTQKRHWSLATSAVYLAEKRCAGQWLTPQGGPLLLSCLPLNLLFSGKLSTSAPAISPIHRSQLTVYSSDID